MDGLTLAELQTASFIGCQRRISALRLGRSRPVPGSPPWEAHIVGACGELTLAKALDRHWLGSPGTLDPEGDVAGYQVRTTTLPGGCLIVKPSDPDAAVFVLVVGPEPAYRIAGWMVGGDAKVPRWWRADVAFPAWFVPQSALAPFDVVAA